MAISYKKLMKLLEPRGMKLYLKKMESMLQQFKTSGRPRCYGNYY
jgi:hypothetical protein